MVLAGMDDLAFGVQVIESHQETLDVSLEDVKRKSIVLETPL